MHLSINIQRLAGIKRIIGIDQQNDSVRIVELKRSYNPFKRSSQFEVLRSTTIQWEEGETLDQKADKLKTVLASSKTKLAVANIPSNSVRSIVVEVPKGVENINEWIIEHHEKLLKFPVSLNEILTGYEVLKESESGTIIEVTFVKNSEIDKTTSLLQKVGLELLALSAGSRDAVNIVMTSFERFNDREIQFWYVEEARATKTAIIKGKRTEVAQTTFEAVPENTLPDENVTIIVSGNQSPEMNGKGILFNKILNLSSDYTLAAGLAVKGFLPEISPLNFLKNSLQAKVKEKIARQVFHRVSLGLGVCLIVLLLAQISTQYYVQTRLEQIDNKILSSGPAYTEVELLKNQVASLEFKLRGKEATIKIAHTGELLHEIAENTPEGVWFSSMKVQEPSETNKSTLAIIGYAKSPEVVTDFIKNLKRSGLSLLVNLVRSGSEQNAATVFPINQKRSPFTTFELTAQLEEK